MEQSNNNQDNPFSVGATDLHSTSELNLSKWYKANLSPRFVYNAFSFMIVFVCVTFYPCIQALASVMIYGGVYSNADGIPFFAISIHVTICILLTINMNWKYPKFSNTKEDVAINRIFLHSIKSIFYLFVSNAVLLFLLLMSIPGTVVNWNTFIMNKTLNWDTMQNPIITSSICSYLLTMLYIVFYVKNSKTIESVN